MRRLRAPSLPVPTIHARVCGDRRGSPALTPRLRGSSPLIRRPCNPLYTLSVFDRSPWRCSKGLARWVPIDQRPAMRASLVITVSQVLTLCCVFLLAVLSLWPGEGLGFLFVLPELKMMRTGLPGQLEHLVAYAGSAAIGMAGYGPSRGGVRVIGGFWVYAAMLEYLQHFSPDRHPSFLDFAASALGALCGGLAVALLWRRPFREAVD